MQAVKNEEEEVIRGNRSHQRGPPRLARINFATPHLLAPMSPPYQVITGGREQLHHYYYFPSDDTFCGRLYQHNLIV